tara:strand:- start:1092 stop:1829 length:738 start_codon:yes stop_codon:yes gene_type:complete
MKNKNVLFLGALSDIAKSTVHKFGENGYNLQLAARNLDDLKKISADLKIRYNVDINVYEFDILKTENHQNFIKDLKEIPSIIICAVGFMGEQKKSENNTKLRVKVLRTNYESPVNIISDFANIFENRGYGTIVGISSVAGDRGRSSNYIYGSAKAGFTTFLSGLRNRLAKKNVHVLTVIPGTVYTKMTLNSKLPKFFTSSPNEVAEDIYNAVIKKKNIIYTMKIWRFIMFIIKFIPEGIFKNKSL